MHFLVILVAFGLADRQGDGQGQAAQEMFEIGGVRAGRIDAHMEVRPGMLLVQQLQTFVEGLVARSAFENRHGLGGGLTIGRRKARDGHRLRCRCQHRFDPGWSLRHKGYPQRRKEPTCWPAVRTRRCGRVREPPPGNLRPGDPRDERSGREIYQNLEPKPEGTIFSKRSRPQGSAELLTTQPPLWQVG